MFEFSLQLFKKLFPALNFGNNDFFENHLKFTLNFSILLTKENFMLIKTMERMNKVYNLKHSDLDMKKMLSSVDSEDQLEWLYKNWDVFIYTHTRFALFLRD